MGETFSQRLRECIKRQGLTQKELAARANITDVALSRYVNGTRIPKANTLRGKNINSIRGGASPLFFCTGSTQQEAAGWGVSKSDTKFFQNIHKKLASIIIL